MNPSTKDMKDQPIETTQSTEAARTTLHCLRNTPSIPPIIAPRPKSSINVPQSGVRLNAPRP